MRKSCDGYGCFLLCRDIKRTVGYKRTGDSSRGKRGVKDLSQNLRKLVEQLGEAIHESVSESEQIAGVVQAIRKQGFDVLLMLEATIGLNEVVEQPAADGEGAEAGGDGFTPQDVNFLRSLRIAIEGENVNGREGPEEDPGP